MQEQDGRYFRHIDGGLYQLLHHARHADDGKPVMVYLHLWPYEPSVWVRRVDEFAQRFEEISELEYTRLSAVDRHSGQQAVAAAKQKRRQAQSASENAHPAIRNG